MDILTRLNSHWIKRKKINHYQFQVFSFHTLRSTVRIWPLIPTEIACRSSKSNYHFFFSFNWKRFCLVLSKWMKKRSEFNSTGHRMALKKNDHINTHTHSATLLNRKTWSIDICIHKSRSICQRNDVIQNECYNHKTSNEILTKLQRYNVEHERFSLLFTKPFMKLAQWIPLIFVHISFQFDSIEWSAFTQHRRFSFSATIHEFILQQKKISFWVFLLDLTMAWQMNNKYDILFRLLFALCEDVWMILYFAGCSSRSSGLANLSSDYRHLFNAPNSHSSKKKLIL